MLHKMSSKKVVISALVVIAFGWGLLTFHKVILEKTNLLASIASTVLVDLANFDRTQSKLPELTTSPLLTKAAQEKADDMAKRGYFAHASPDGTTPWHWLDVVGYDYTYAGENLAIDFSESVDVNNAWMNSPAHRANILNSGFTEIGIASAQGVYQGRQTTFIVQMFAKPKISSTTKAVIK